MPTNDAEKLWEQVLNAVKDSAVGVRSLIPLNWFVCFWIKLFNCILLHFGEDPTVFLMYVLDTDNCCIGCPKFPYEMSACTTGRCAILLYLWHRTCNDHTLYLGFV